MSFFSLRATLYILVHEYEVRNRISVLITSKYPESPADIVHKVHTYLAIA